MRSDSKAPAKSKVATPSGRIAYTEAGAGPVALFVHGVLLNGHLWRHQLAELSDVRRCIAVDLLAHGDTEIAPDQDVSVSANARMLLQFLDALEVDQVDLVGNDSGGGIAQIFAARHPEFVRSLVLTDCDTHDNWPPKQAEPLHQLAKQGGVGPIGRRMLKDVAFARQNFAIAFEHPERLSEQDFRTWLAPLFESEASTRNFERFVASFDNRQTVAIAPLLRQLQAPTLIVWGTSDPFFPVKWAYWLRGAIPRAQEVVELEGAKLFFPWERPDEFAGAVKQFWN